MLVFSPLFRRFFLLMMIYSSLPPLLSVSAPQNTPFLGFFGVFPSHAYIYITDSVFPPLTSNLFFSWWCFRSLDNTERISPLFPPPAIPGAAVVGRRSRSFSRLSPPVSDGRTNKMAACCFYSSDTGGGLEVQQH